MYRLIVLLHQVPAIEPITSSYMNLKVFVQGLPGLLDAFFKNRNISSSCLSIKLAAKSTDVSVRLTK